jgi:hypothetical protein
MAHEIAGNASEPLERAANTTGDGVMGVVGAATDTAAGARDKVSAGRRDGGWLLLRQGGVVAGGRSHLVVLRTSV